VERHPLTKARIGGAARPACRPATTITIPTSKPRLLTTRAASMPVSLRDKFKPGGSPSLPQSLRHTRISLFYPRRRLQGYISADERCSDEAWAIGHGIPMPFGLRWNVNDPSTLDAGEKSTRCNGCSLVRQFQPCYTCPRSPSSCVAIRPCVDFKVPLLIGAYAWRQRVHGARIPYAAYV
jgi:hypothetical protein